MNECTNQRCSRTGYILLGKLNRKQTFCYLNEYIYVYETITSRQLTCIATTMQTTITNECTKFILQLLDNILFVSLNDIVEKEVNYSTKYKFQHNETDFFAWNEANLSMTTISQNHFQNGQRMNNYKRNNYMASIKMLTIREFMRHWSAHFSKNGFALAKNLQHFKELFVHLIRVSEKNWSIQCNLIIF